MFNVAGWSNKPWGPLEPLQREICSGYIYLTTRSEKNKGAKDAGRQNRVTTVGRIFTLCHMLNAANELLI